MLADSEGEMVVGVAADVELVGVFEHFFVPVRGRVDEEHRRARSKDAAALSNRLAM